MTHIPSRQPESTTEELSSEDQARRNFLGKAGRFAVVTPPAITLLLGTSLGSKAIAGSNGSHPGKDPKPVPHPRKPPLHHKPVRPSQRPKAHKGPNAKKGPKAHKRPKAHVASSPSKG